MKKNAFTIKQRKKSNETIMPIRRKSSIQKKFFESMGQGSLFGHDNIHFKTVNLPQKQKFINLCKKFNVKLIVNKNKIFFNFIKIN